MSYQFFGDSENIFGYKDLIVKIYYSCAQLNIYIGLKYVDQLTKQQTSGVEPDDVLKIISTKYETKVIYNLNEFSANLTKEKSFVAYGELINEFQVEHEQSDKQPLKRHFCIYKANNSVPGFVAYHERMQTFLMWYINAASYIEIDDDRWDFFVVYEKIPKHPNCWDETQLCFIGYATVYRYYAYPQNIRPRISQFLILPPFQQMGLGSKLLKTIYDNYNNKLVVDITVEDPSEEFQRLRDVLDCKLCMTLDWFNEDNLKRDWTMEMAREAKNKFKLNEKQTRRVYEILKFRKVNRNNKEEYESFRSYIKKRLNAPYVKQIQNIEKLYKRRAISQSYYVELMKMSVTPEEYRMKTLEQDYEEIEEEYLRVIEKL